MVRRASGCKNAFDQLLFYCLALRRSQYFRHQCSTGSSFRAFRFTRKGYAASVSGRAANGCAVATRCPGGRGGLYRRADEGVRPYNRGDGFRYPRRGRCPHRPVAEAPSTAGQRQRKEKLDVSRTSPGQKLPQGQRVSVPDCRAGPPAIPRRRQEGCACADRPAEALFLFHRARRILFLAQPKREWGAHLPSHQHGCFPASHGTHPHNPKFHILR